MPLFPGASPCGALQVLAPSGPSEELFPFYDDLAPGENHAGVSLHGETLEHRIVHLHVMSAGPDRVGRLRVPEDDIRVTARGDLPFARVHPEDPGGRGGGQLDETIQREPSQVHAVVVDELEPVFYSRTAVGDLGEIVLAQNLLVPKAERAVIRGDHLQVIVLQAVPELWLMLLWPERRGEHVLGSLEVRPGKIV